MVHRTGPAKTPLVPRDASVFPPQALDLRREHLPVHQQAVTEDKYRSITSRIIIEQLSIVGVDIRHEALLLSEDRNKPERDEWKCNEHPSRISGKFLFKTGPAINVIILRDCQGRRESGQLMGKPRLEHEGERVRDLDGFEFRIARMLESRVVRTVGQHHVVKA